MAFDPPIETPEEFKEKHILLWVPVSWVQIMLFMLDRMPAVSRNTAFESKVARIKQILRSKLYAQ